MTIPCESLDQVRTEIDRIDRAIVALIAQRGAYVRQAAAFKRTQAEVRAPARVAQVLDKVDALARELDADPAVVRAVYETMIDRFIRAEAAEQACIAQRLGAGSEESAA